MALVFALPAWNSATAPTLTETTVPTQLRLASAGPMSRRTDQRRAAAFAIYQQDVTGRSLEDVLGRDASTFTRALTYAADDYRDELDEVIGRHAQGWTIDRIAPLEKAIMRIALLEMRHP